MTDDAPPAPARPAPGSAGTPPAVAGMVAGAVALGMGELVSGLSPPSLVLSVGEAVIDRVPPALKDFAVSTFVTYDKAVLVAGVVVSALTVASALGVLAGRRFAVAAGGFVAFGGAGVAAALDRSPSNPALTVAAGGAGVAAGLYALRRLLDTSSSVVDGRRRFLRLALTGAAVAAVAGLAGRLAARVLASGTDPVDVVLPPVAAPLRPPPAGASMDVPGLSPLLTPTDRFYRIDTALAFPRTDVEDWRLRVTGLVDRPLEIRYAELLAMPQVEADVTIACVSNEVGGDLVGNARWQGVRLAEVLRRAGVRAGATQVVGRSLDGWTAGFPTEVAVDGRQALVAVGMNGEPLPVKHGFPARLVVPGLYGYVSATKWLAEIELTTLDAFDAYWVPRGWAKQAPVRTQSRIDVPRPRATVPAGRLVVAGVAWAPTRGISRVEVAIDDGPWQPAVLADPLGADSWRLWRFDTEVGPGPHQARVRATDGTGTTQPAERRSPRPDGATGYHAVRFQAV